MSVTAPEGSPEGTEALQVGPSTTTPTPSACLKIVEALEDHFSDGQITTELSNYLFSDDLEGVVCSVTEGEDHPTQNYEAYMRYSDLIESILMAFAQEHNVEEEELVNACNEAAETQQGRYTCVDYILAATDYICFLALVSDYRGMK